MQLTTHQIYALFAITVAVVVLISISYISGLRTGRKEGYQSGSNETKSHYQECIQQLQESLSSTATKRRLEALDHQGLMAEASKLRQTIATKSTTIMRTATEIGRLQAKALAPEDVLNIKLAARQLAIAAKHIARSGTNKPNQAALAETALKEIASRYIDAAPNPSPKQAIERDENGFALPPRIDYIGDGKSTWERIDEEHRALGLPAPQCM